jgi:hypothetical protein
MQTIYLWVNAVLYAVFGVWCLVAPGTTARNLGYEVLSASGESEYRVVYGGLQIGLAVFFAYCARANDRAGLVFAVALYLPIVLVRAVTVAKWPVTSTTLAVGGLEALLLATAIWMLMSQR